MGEIRKITDGYVVQRWDRDTGKFLGQLFVCEDLVKYELQDGRGFTDLRLDDFVDGRKTIEPEYRCFDMVQDPLSFTDKELEE